LKSAVSDLGFFTLRCSKKKTRKNDSAYAAKGTKTCLRGIAEVVSNQLDALKWRIDDSCLEGVSLILEMERSLVVGRGAAEAKPVSILLVAKTPTATGSWHVTRCPRRPSCRTETEGGNIRLSKIFGTPHPDYIGVCTVELFVALKEG